jgi:hypothetical protein
VLYYDQGITYCYFKTAVNNKLIGLVDSDFGSDPDTWKSLTDYLMYVNGNTISWRSSQHFFYLLLRFSEVDFVVASQADQAVVHLRDPLKGFGYTHKKPTDIWEDNVSCITGIPQGSLSSFFGVID